MKRYSSLRGFGIWGLSGLSEGARGGFWGSEPEPYFARALGVRGGFAKAVLVRLGGLALRTSREGGGGGSARPTHLLCRSGT